MKITDKWKFFSLAGIDVELARSIEERIMLEDAQSWMNGRTINEIKDIRSGTVTPTPLLLIKIKTVLLVIASKFATLYFTVN